VTCLSAMRLVSVIQPAWVRPHKRRPFILLRRLTERPAQGPSETAGLGRGVPVAAFGAAISDDSCAQLLPLSLLPCGPKKLTF